MIVNKVQYSDWLDDGSGIRYTMYGIRFREKGEENSYNIYQLAFNND